jgi:hypothetical protein
MNSNKFIAAFFLMSLGLFSARASQEFVSTLEELPKDSAKLIVVGEVKAIRKPPETADWEYDVAVREVILGELKAKEIVAVIHYQSRMGISIKTLRSGLESQMSVGKEYVLLFNWSIDPASRRGNLMRAEELSKRKAVIKKFKGSKK